MPGEKHAAPCIKEAVCVHTKKVYDSCRDKDCREDIRVYLTREGQCLLDKSVGVRGRRAELLWVSTELEPVNFNRGFYTIDVRYFYRITAEVSCTGMRPQEIQGLAVYDKRVMLFGSEGNAKIFTSGMQLSENTIMKSNLPTAVVEVVEPILLSMRVADACNCPREPECGTLDVPRAICGCFSDELITPDGDKRLYVTLGQFSIIKLERDSQLLMPAYDFCIPDKECTASVDEDPCALFKRISFPTDEFFPPNRDRLEDACGTNCGVKCGC